MEWVRRNSAGGARQKIRSLDSEIGPAPPFAGTAAHTSSSAIGLVLPFPSHLDL
jgi:hypothetical protein